MFVLQQQQLVPGFGVIHECWSPHATVGFYRIWLWDHCSIWNLPVSVLVHSTQQSVVICAGACI